MFRRLSSCCATALCVTAFVMPIAMAAIPEPNRSDEQNAVFALVIGVNRSVDPELKPLRYADDDGARYFDLFRSLGARTYLLTRPDDNTQRLHPQAVAEAFPPIKQELSRVVTTLRDDVARARQRGLKTSLYVIYAGHGNMRQGEGYISLEDARLNGIVIRDEILRPIHADQSHLIVDACHSYFLAYSRGPGGTRRAIQGFSELQEAFPEESIGLLFSTSAARESHEWEAFQSGVFSHEVRSAMYGAADVDGDGLVSYREVAAFISRANAAIPNERFRPQVFARPPKNGTTLLDLRWPKQRYIEIEGQAHGQYLMEDQRGVRLADFHNSAQQTVRIHRPASSGTLYLRRTDSEQEYVIPSGPDVVQVAMLTPQAPKTTTRGAAHQAFSMLFSLPFDRTFSDGFRLPDKFVPPVEDALSLTTSLPTWRKAVGWTAIGVSAASAASGLALFFKAKSLRDETGGSQEEITRRNSTISTHNTAAVVLYSVAGTGLVAGLVTLLWPHDAPQPTIELSTRDFSVAFNGRF